MFDQIAQQYKGKLLNFKPLAPISNRTAWESLSLDLKTQLLANGEHYLQYSYPPILSTYFMSFCRTGNRVDYETIYFQRRYALNSLILAECVENKGRFLDPIINGIFVLCEESGWQLPAHNSYIRDGQNQLLPDSTKPILDLFSCETGALLALAVYLLEDVFHEISPVITKRIYYELKTRIIVPYLTEHFWWMGRDKEPMNNWTIWCTQNILLTIFTTNQSEEIKQKTFSKACKSVDYFLKEYGEDGCCDEGAQYYRHAGLCLFNTMEVLHSITDGFFDCLYQNEKIKNIASYIVHVHVAGDYYINFADCSPKAGKAGVREFLFGKRIQDKELINFAINDYKTNPDYLLKEECNLFYHLQAIFTHQEIKQAANFPLQEKRDIFYKSVGLFIAHDHTYSVAVKAGDNDDSHNHNDIGSFTIYKNGLPLFIDIGVESYTKKTFSPERYEIWTMQSDYHNLPTINGMMQQNGAEYKATNVLTHFSKEKSSIQLDLASAYPKTTTVQQYMRIVTLEKNHCIFITDKIKSAATCIPPIILNFITYEKPSLINNSTIGIGTLGTLTFSEQLPIEIETLPITDTRLQKAWEHDLYRIRVLFQQNKLSMQIL